jgi:hypothetical protein
MNQHEKLSHNLQLLTTVSKTVFIYIPTQFGHLSEHQFRAKVTEIIKVPDGNGVRIYKLLETKNANKTGTRKILWWHKQLAKDKRGRTFEYSFEQYSDEDWATLKEKAETND